MSANGICAASPTKSAATASARNAGTRSHVMSRTTSATPRNAMIRRGVGSIGVTGEKDIAVRGSRFATGGWRLAAGDSRFAVRDLRVAVRDSNAGTGNRKLETGNWKLETGNWKLETSLNVFPDRRSAPCPRGNRNRSRGRPGSRAGRAGGRSRADTGALAASIRRADARAPRR